MKIDFERAVSLLRENDCYVILTHANPDGDTLGSGCALALALKKLGKKSKVVNNDIIPEKYLYITEMVNNDDFEEGFVVSVDVADTCLLGEEIEKQYSEKVSLAIDHHGTNRLFAKETYVESDSASACEIIFLIIKALGVEFDKQIANCLYTGCATDTGCFKYSNVTPRTHEIAAELIKLGAEHAWINVKMFETKKKGFIKLQALCLDSMEFYLDDKVCVLTVTRKMLEETGTTDEDVDAIVAFSRQIEGVLVGVTIKEKADNVYKVSVRTHEEIDAAAICSAFGGGGHLRAAGCSFNCRPDEIKPQIVKEIEKQTGALT
ncbi:MAG: bifunctional oligoribonuclease/PAP phosphatase NrnA [Faecalibacterium sp.]|nr:bifunctional oligoribonuclease/PAP phosphatase NrnA [Ruminococcus sp.]MCM1391564.1 bifunctional oligoribonuclease/PAP phosphatase NrnA [Ruminococcus sp.]MCM1485121.1 bifunctional oligoribonuclease/PAP phosphatase NrnA [Faecalibacterium sp.]